MDITAPFASARAAAARFALLGAALLLPSGAWAGDTFTDTVGGRGGTPFSLRCPSGGVLTGLFGKTGAWFDQIGPLCNKGTNYSASVGGWGGHGGTAECPGGSMVASLRIIALQSANRFVDTIQLRCVSMTNRSVATAAVDYETDQASGDGSSHPERHDRMQGVVGCGPRDVVGIQGRAGDSIDALGLICGDPVSQGSPANGTASPLNVLKAAVDPTVCKPGFVWREAVAGDKTCVTVATRAKNARLNSTARFRSTTGQIGGTCVSGFVWREATTSDRACVSVEDRSEAAQDNARAAQRRVGP